MQKKIHLKIDDREEKLLIIEGDEVLVVADKNQKQFKAKKNQFAVELEVVQKAKGSGYLTLLYRFKNGRPRVLFTIDGCSKERLVQFVKFLEQLEKIGIKTELLEPFGFDA